MSEKLSFEEIANSAVLAPIDEKIEKLNEQIEKDNYIHSMEVDIGI